MCHVNLLDLPHHVFYKGIAHQNAAHLLKGVLKQLDPLMAALIKNR
jgi:hypothetical protein